MANIGPGPMVAPGFSDRYPAQNKHHSVTDDVAMTVGGIGVMSGLDYVGNQAERYYDTHKSVKAEVNQHIPPEGVGGNVDVKPDAISRKMREIAKAK
jgi:hypothetical protein